MSKNPSFQVVISNAVIEARSVEDKLRLEPIGGILADGSTEGYRLDELDKMVEIFARYDQPELLNDFKQLVESRRRSGADRG
jgi:hypothetical protein